MPRKKAAPGKIKQRIASLTGSRFGKLIVTGEAGRQGRHIVVSADCDCGKATHVRLDALKTGHTTSCGCVGRQRYMDHQANKAARLTPATAQKAFAARCQGRADWQIAKELRISKDLVGPLFRRHRKALLKHLPAVTRNVNRSYEWLAKSLHIAEAEAAWLVKLVRRTVRQAKAAATSAAKASIVIADHAFARIRRVKDLVKSDTVLPGKLLSFARRPKKDTTQLGSVLGLDLTIHANTEERRSLLDWFTCAIRDTTTHRRGQRFRFLHAA